jgi:hypothetical protein
MRFRKSLAALALCLFMLGSSSAAHAGEAVGRAYASQVDSAPSTTVPSREGSTLDRITGVAAVLSILIVGVAGVYIYRLIRKGL